MSFMQIQTCRGEWYIVEASGETDWIKVDNIGQLDLPDGVSFNVGDTITELGIRDALTEASSPGPGVDETDEAFEARSEKASCQAKECWENVYRQLRDCFGEHMYHAKSAEDLESVALVECWACRESAAGYLDRTEWVFGDTEKEAIAEYASMYNLPTCDQCGTIHNETQWDDDNDRSFCCEDCRDDYHSRDENP